MHLPLSDEQTLLNAGIRLTAVRLMVWQQIRHTEAPSSKRSS